MQAPTWDLWAAAFAAALAAITATGPPGALRSLLAAFLVLGGLGYAVSIALFPRRAATSAIARGEDAIEREDVAGAGGLGGIERAGASFLLSLAALATLSLAVDLAGFGFHLPTVVLAAAAATALACVVGALRRRSLVPGVAYVPSWPSRGARWDLGTRLVAVLACLAVVGAGVAAWQVLPTFRDPEPFTEFYVTAATGKLSALPRDVAAGTAVDLRLVVVSHEPSAATYELRGEVARGPVAASNRSEERATFAPIVSAVLFDEPLSLGVGANETRLVRVSFDAPGLHRAAFTLRESSPREDTLVLHWWVNVTAGSP